MKQMIGSWAFLIGVILAIVFGFVGMDNTVATILVVLGLIVGLINITDKEITPFLMSGMVLVLVSYFGGMAAIEVIPWFAEILAAMMYIFVPATIIVALKSVFGMAKN